MSRVGKNPVTVPSGVQVDLKSEEIVIKGGKAELSLPLTEDVKVSFNQADSQITVEPVNDSTKSRAMWGTTRNNINNMIVGVSEGYSTRLELFGVGYRATVQGSLLTLVVGYSHEIKYVLPEGISAVLEKPTLVVLSGANKQLLGQVVGELIAFRPIEPYKGKGIYIEGTQKRLKEGKKK